jgi:hypothetical protein
MGIRSISTMFNKATEITTQYIIGFKFTYRMNIAVRYYVNFDIIKIKWWSRWYLEAREIMLRLNTV